MDNSSAILNQTDKNHNRMTLILILLLLALRLPFMTVIGVFFYEASLWVMPIFENGTYLITAVLIWWERKRLEQFHIGYIALGIIILIPFVYSILFHFYDPYGTIDRLGYPLFRMIVAGLLLVTLIVQRPVLKKVTMKSVLWIIIAIAVGIVIGSLMGYVYSRLMPSEGSMTHTFPQMVSRFIRQLFYAAVNEEPLFRGFLWGYLMLKGWKNLWILLFQAGLFMIGHSYYITQNPGSLIGVFIAACILGIIAWKSRSIAGSMVTHGLVNSVSVIVQSLGL